MTEIQTLHQRFCDYSRTFKGNTPRTIAWFEEIFDYFLRFSQIETPAQITQEKVEAWLSEGKSQKSWSAKTIRNRIQAIASFVQWLAKREYIPKNPLANIDRPPLPKKIPKHLPQEKALKLIDWAKSYPFTYRFERKRTPAIIATFIFTGIRLQELLNLKMNDVDIENKVLSIQCGKGQKDRNIPLQPTLIRILEDYLNDRKRLNKLSPYFFTSMRGNDRMKPNVIKEITNKLRKASGIYFYPHLLRHTFAVLMLEGGCNIYALSKMMGHSDIKTTTIYLTATTSHLQIEMSKHPLNGLC